MKIPQNPFNDALQTCLNNIEEFKKRVEKESELKNSYFLKWQTFIPIIFRTLILKKRRPKGLDKLNTSSLKTECFSLTYIFSILQQIQRSGKFILISNCLALKWKK